MSTSTLVDVDKRPPATPGKKKRERIVLIEEKPLPEWFQHARDAWNHPIWFLRFHATGLRPRRYGPFPTKHKALLFLDGLLNELGNALAEAAMNLDKYQVKDRRFHCRSGHYPVVEDELIRVEETGR